jgi:hypothetical protein
VSLNMKSTGKRSRFLFKAIFFKLASCFCHRLLVRDLFGAPVPFSSQSFRYMRLITKACIATCE